MKITENKSNMVYYRLSIFIFAFAVFASSALSRYGIVSAQPFTSERCYEQSAGLFEEADCPEGLDPADGKCVSIVTSARGIFYYDMDCQTGTVGERVMPESIAEELRAEASGTEASRVLNTDCAPEDGQSLSAGNCDIIEYLVKGINFMSALAMLSIIGSIVVAGYQYMTAKDNSGQVEAARKRILWAIVALGIFIFMYSALNFIVPGGVL